MDLRTYLTGKSRKEFAVKLQTSVFYVNNLCQGVTPGKKLALKIEQATGGAVTLRELLFPKEATK